LKFAENGVGFCKIMPGAVIPFQRIVKRHSLDTTDIVFPNERHELFNIILDELELKFDREGLHLSHQEHGRCISGQCAASEGHRQSKEKRQKAER